MAQEEPTQEQPLKKKTQRRRRPRKPATSKAETAADESPSEHQDAEVAQPESEQPPAKAAPVRRRVRESDAARPEKESTKDQEPESGRARPARRRRRPPRRSTQPRPKAVPRTMLVSVTSERTQIAILQDRDLVEHYVAHSEGGSIVGNIYVGRVQNVLPGMEAAFLDIGETRNAVLYAGEVAFDEEIEGPPPRIETMLKSGQTVLAQVTKDPMGSKGARLTTEVSVAGRYLVLVPNADSVGISRRLDDDERRRLRDIAGKIKPNGHGLIVRTAAEGMDEEHLERDIARLVKVWDEIEKKSKRSKPPKLIHSEPHLAMRVIRDLFTTEVEKVIIDDEATFNELKEYVDDLTPYLSDRLELAGEGLPLFERYHVVEQIRKAIDRKVWLKSGGHIVIDRTEAMTVIDVNTGRFVGKSTLEETVLHTNLEAAEEIAKQLRLRDIGGIIIIDFIDMAGERNREELVRTFRNALAEDRTRTQVFGVSEVGTIQMTRKNVSEGLLEAFSTKCEVCEGRGVILTDFD